jgi:hypothetical protein
VVLDDGIARDVEVSLEALDELLNPRERLVALGRGVAERFRRQVVTRPDRRIGIDAVGEGRLPRFPRFRRNRRTGVDPDWSARSSPILGGTGIGRPPMRDGEVGIVTVPSGCGNLAVIFPPK